MEASCSASRTEPKEFLSDGMEDSFSIVNMPAALDDDDDLLSSINNDVMIVSNRLNHLRFKSLPGPRIALPESQRVSNEPSAVENNVVDNLANEEFVCVPAFQEMKEINDNLVKELGQSNNKLRLVLNRFKDLQTELIASQNALKDMGKLKEKVARYQTKLKRREEDHSFSMHILKSQVEEARKSEAQLVKTVDRLNQEINEKDERIKDLALEVMNAKGRCKTAEEQMVYKIQESEETITALRAQLGIYVKDFAAVDENRRNALEVVKQLDLVNAEQRNKIAALETEKEELKEKLSAIEHCGDFVQVYNHQANQTIPKQVPTLACPKCWRQFAELSVLEQHVDECLMTD